MRVAHVATVLVFAWAISFPPPAFGAEEPLAGETISRMADVLGDRQLAPLDETAGGIVTRGASLRDLYRATVRVVPIVVAQDGTESSIVISVNRTESWGLVVTNRHVVEKPFRTNKGEPRVLLLFYDPQLASEPFSPDKIQRWIQAGEKSPFCDALITLAAAFSQAGAHAIVASLWKVNDAATRDSMVAFYRALPAVGRAAALQRAQLTVLKNPLTANPHYWAPFIPMGAR